MPKYTVQLSDGRVVTVEADQPPTEEQILAQLVPAHTPEQTNAISEEEWAQMPAGQKMRNVLQWGGKAIAGMTGMGAEGRSAVENPKTALAGAVAPSVAAPVLKALGKGVYKGGVALLPKGLKQQHPDIAQTGFREGIALTRRGATKAGEAVTASRNQADEIIAAAERGGAAPIHPMEVVRELRPVGAKLATQKSLGLPDETPALVQRSRAFINQNRGGIQPTRGQTMKREAQGLADTAYKARDRGAVINSTEALTNESQARGLRLALEKRAPAVGPVNARTQSLMGVQKGAEHAADTGHILSRLGGVGAGAVVGSAGGTVPALAAAGVGSMLTTPGGLTRTGLALKRTGQAIDSDALRAALMALLTNEQGGGEP